MFCKKCGAELESGAKFCPRCGFSVGEGRAVRKPAVKTEADATPRDGGSIALCDDGVYRWIYEYSLFRHLGIFFLIWKIFFFIILGIFAFILLLDVIEGNADGEAMLGTLKIFGIALLVMTALVVVSYLIYAAIMGGKYIVMFEMDEKGINHRQVDKQAKKARKIASAAALTGAASGNFSAMAAGMNVRTEMYTEFGSVRKLKAYPRKNLIKIRQVLSSNQVFVRDEDFDFVLDYIRSRVPEKAYKK